MRTTDEEIMRQLMATFRLEADEHLQALNDSLLELEKTRDQAAALPLIENIFREAHSLKGAARAVGAAMIETIAHGVENVSAAAKREEIEPSQALYDLLYEALDRIAIALEAIAEGRQIDGDADDLLERLDGAVKGRAAPKAPQPPHAPGQSGGGGENGGARAKR